MTTPGGVPNLPQGALTLANLESTLQDTSGTAMKGRAVERFPSIFDGSTGLSPASDITPFGILTKIWAGVNSLIANADPADVQGPEDLPPLVLEFIEGLPLIGQFVTLVEAILGVYDGDDASLLTVQAIFAPLRAIVGAFGGIDLSDPNSILKAIQAPVQAVIDALVAGFGGGTTTGNNPAAILQAIATQALAAAALPLQALDAVNAILAQLLGGQKAIQNNPAGASQNDDYSTMTLSGRRTNVTGTMAIRNGVLQTVQLAADYLGTTGTPRKPLTQKCFTIITLDAIMDGVVRAYICSDVTMSNYAALEVYSGFGGEAVRIVTGSSPTLTAVQAQADLDPGQLASGTTFELKYDPAANKYIVLRNTLPIDLEWEDADNIVTHAGGAAKLFVGAVTNALDRNEVGFYGPGIRKQIFGDWL